MTLAHLDDDGAHEVVATSPGRPVFRTAPLAEAAHARVGGKLAEMRAGAERGSREFVIKRSPAGTIRMALSHTGVLAALWRLWTGKRVSGDEDPGVLVSEVAQDMGVSVSKAQSVLMSLRRNGLVRSVLIHVGSRSTRARYYPTQEAVLTMALGEVIGLHGSVQVGRTKAFKSQARTEPNNLFEFAALLRGGGDAPVLDPEFA